MVFRRKKESDPFRESLSPEQARDYDEYVELFRRGGADEPESWARSEVEEGIAQSARFAFLRGLWHNFVRWRSDDFVRAWADEHRLSDEDRESLRKLVARAAFSATWDVIMLIDEGEGEGVDHRLGWPGWQLVELDSNRTPTGREVGGIHESFISADPSGNEASDFF